MSILFVYLDNIWMWSSTINILTKVDLFLQWAASSFQSSIALINHEQLNIFDKFGQVMLDNLSQRGCSLPGIEACRNKTSHIDRLLSAGTRWFKINNPNRKFSYFKVLFLTKDGPKLAVGHFTTECKAVDFGSGSAT